MSFSICPTDPSLELSGILFEFTPVITLGTRIDRDLAVKFLGDQYCHDLVSEPDRIENVRCIWRKCSDQKVPTRDGGRSPCTIDAGISNGPRNSGCYPFNPQPNGASGNQAYILVT